MLPQIFTGQRIDDPARLEALEESQLLDSIEEESFDRFTRLAKAILGAEASLVTLVTQSRQFFKSHCGLGEPLRTERQNDISYSFCRHVVEGGQPFVVEDAREDERVKTNPAVTEVGVVAYLGMPLATRDGHIFGSLCVVEGHPRKWSESDLSCLSDLADAVMREIEIYEQSTALKRAVEQAQIRAAEREKDLRNISHDLRTPAGAVSSCLEMLSASLENVSEEDAELLELGKESADRMLEMINEILEADQKRTRGGSNLDFKPVSASSLLRRVVNLVRPFATDAGVKLDVRPILDLIFLKADAGLVERCLLNLLTNAVKYSPAGGRITIHIAHGDKGREPVCRITITDQGPGVPDDEKERIFEQFGTGSIPARHGMPSFGIGLSFCKSVVEAHGGWIGVLDAAGGGSTFYCFLPESHPETAA